MSKLLIIIVAALVCGSWTSAVQQSSKWVVKLDEDNWDRMLKNEWMVKL